VSEFIGNDAKAVSSVAMAAANSGGALGGGFAGARG
jgi:hypothetical protein